MILSTLLGGLAIIRRKRKTLQETQVQARGQVVSLIPGDAPGQVISGVKTRNPGLSAGFFFGRLIALVGWLVEDLGQRLSRVDH